MFGSLTEVQDQVLAAEIEAGLLEARRIVERGTAEVQAGRVTEGVQQYRQAGSILRRAVGLARRIAQPSVRARMLSAVGPVVAQWEASNLDERRTAQRGLAEMPAVPGGQWLAAGLVGALAWWLWRR